MKTLGRKILNVRGTQEVHPIISVSIKISISLSLSRFCSWTNLYAPPADRRNRRGAGARSPDSVTSKAYSSRVDIVNRSSPRDAWETSRGFNCAKVAAQSCRMTVDNRCHGDAFLRHLRYGWKRQGWRNDSTMRTARGFRLGARGSRACIPTLSFSSCRPPSRSVCNFLSSFFHRVLLSVQNDRLLPPLPFLLLLLLFLLLLLRVRRGSELIVAIFRRDVLARPACLISVRSFFRQATLALRRVFTRVWLKRRSREFWRILVSNMAKFTPGNWEEFD